VTAEVCAVGSPGRLDDVTRSLGTAEADAASAAIEGRLSAEAQELVARICATVRDLLPRLAEFGPGSRIAHAVTSTATDYLPTALRTFLRLPAEWARTRPVSGTSTSHDVLIDQLARLAAGLDAIRESVHGADAAALVAHGDFLAAKFGPGEVPIVTGLDAARLPVLDEVSTTTPHGSGRSGLVRLGVAGVVAAAAFAVVLSAGQSRAPAAALPGRVAMASADPQATASPTLAGPSPSPWARPTATDPVDTRTCAGVPASQIPDYVGGSYPSEWIPGARDLRPGAGSVEGPIDRGTP
jgi:hypothetical protein